MMGILTKTVLILTISFIVSMAHAAEFGDKTFPDKITIDGTNTELQLNGLGYRTKFFFKVYIGALYTESKISSRDAAQALKGPKRVMMHNIYSEVSKEKLVDAWNDGFENNNSSAQLEALSQRITKFNAMFTSLVTDDIVLIDIVPGKGTTVAIKGDVKGLIEGDDFGVALLDIWLGDEPADDDLKEAMLGL